MGLIDLAIENTFDPVEKSVEIAECIKTKINTYSLKLECAVDGLENIDMPKMRQHWDHVVAAYRKNENYKNVVANMDTWTITYEEVEVDESIKYKINEEDYQLN